MAVAVLRNMRPAGFLRIALLLPWILSAGTGWTAPAPKLHSELPAFAAQSTVKRYRDALQPRLDKDRAALTRKYETHGPKAILPNTPLHNPKLRAAVEKLQGTVRAMSDRRPILIVLEGGDCVGKTSTQEILQHAFPGRVVKTLHYDRQLTPHLRKEAVKHGALRELADALGADRNRGSPSEAARWLRRFTGQLPRAGEVAILDRSQLYSGIVYQFLLGQLSAEQARGRVDAVNALEKSLSTEGHLVKLYLRASMDKTIKKFAERELFHPEKLDAVDYKMLTEHKKIKKIFRMVRKSTSATPWHKINMNHRGKGRVAAIEAIVDELK